MQKSGQTDGSHGKKDRIFDRVLLILLSFQSVSRGKCCFVKMKALLVLK